MGGNGGSVPAHSIPAAERPVRFGVSPYGALK